MRFSIFANRIYIFVTQKFHQILTLYILPFRFLSSLTELQKLSNSHLTVNFFKLECFPVQAQISKTSFFSSFSKYFFASLNDIIFTHLLHLLRINETPRTKFKVSWKLSIVYVCVCTCTYSLPCEKFQLILKYCQFECQYQYHCWIKMPQSDYR